MDALNPRAVAGNNQPPLEERLTADHAGLVKRAKEATDLVPAKIRPIESAEEAQQYTDTAADILTIWDEANEAFEPEKKPWREGGNTVDTFFAFRKNLKAAADRAKAALGDWQIALRRKADAEAALEAEKARKEAEAFDEPEPVYTAPVAFKEVARVVAPSGAMASGSVKWDYRIVDFDKVPRECLMENKPAITAAIAGLKARGIDIKDAKIPGLEIFEAAKVAIRR